MNIGQEFKRLESDAKTDKYKSGQLDAAVFKWLIEKPLMAMATLAELGMPKDKRSTGQSEDKPDVWLENPAVATDVADELSMVEGSLDGISARRPDQEIPHMSAAEIALAVGSGLPEDCGAPSPRREVQAQPMVHGGAWKRI